MSKGWSNEELLASVVAYVEMQRHQQQGQPFVKKHYYENLAAKFGRTENAFEYRMRNISHVMTLLGRDWIAGLTPANNVGAEVVGKIKALITQIEGMQDVPIKHVERHLIENLGSHGGGFTDLLPIAPNAPTGVNWVTVFIAENGGRKSFLLRLITEAALGKTRFTPSTGASITVEPLNVLPKRVIAISGTPLDRFPRAGTRDLKSKRRSTSYEGHFVYLGQRASNGMSGVGQSERSFVGSLLSNRHSLKNRANALRDVFSRLGLKPWVSIKLRSSGPARKFFENPRSFALLLETPEEVCAQQRETNSNSHETRDLLKAYKELQTIDLGRMRDVFDLLPADQATLKISPSTSVSHHGLSLAMWELLLRMGVVEIEETKFRKNDSSKASLVIGDRLSSGQWNWLGSLGALAVELRNDTLILIDEPENSLHPQWQRAYMPELQKLMNGFERCQVIVATHSPLIASGVSPAWGNIQTLRKANSQDEKVCSESITSAYGWKASDVYDELFAMETTRAPSFLDTADNALKRIASGKRITTEESQVWINTLENDIQSLPPFDTLKDVLSGIVNTLRQKNRAGRADRE